MRLPSDTDISGRDFGAEELRLLLRVVESGTLSGTRGSQVKLFEREFAARHGVPYACAVLSGGAACHSAVAAIDPEPGEEVIVSALAGMGVVTAILYQGAVPVFADVDPYTLVMTAETVAPQVSSSTRAIIVDHLFGQPCDVESVRAAAPGVPIIEDCCHAPLATVGGKLTGTMGEIAFFQFGQGSHMTTGEGGLAMSSDPHYGRRMMQFAGTGWAADGEDADPLFLAPNYRMSELQGAVARAQLVKLEGCVSRRRRVAEMLTEFLKDSEVLTIPVPADNTTHSYARYPLLVDPGLVPGGADALSDLLKEEGISCTPGSRRKLALECGTIAERRTFGESGYPLSLRPDLVYRREDYPDAHRVLDRLLVLPCNEFYTEEHVDFLAEQIRRGVGRLQSASVAS
jgi:dTDP-4-amino-4,6-dideoxygalactose transaminase